MSDIKPRVVSIHYTLTNDDGEVIDSSVGGEPLAYLEGAQNIIPGLENALRELSAGDKKKVSVDPADAYGEYSAELVQVVPLEAFEGVEKVEPGMQFHAQTAGGARVIVVMEVSDDTATIDANHPLAGQTLHFDVEVMEMREPTEEEMSHGHVHGEGGHHH
ncbi:MULTISPECIES: FKBP-type peptidyl-prolyl cis-trans isomerase [unclassified Hahella]|uniref:FKBP-type peptidyl-prolyl cis-trans isomerase n=1 Tax=unclassified Hahella TaxID=2624107 RepID=UPI000FDD32AE|nr:MULTISPECIES: peptidylprolyl isomerase [unclassified Hahella]AZZ95005.1 peptidylprolyl isomerase [Hahella sp. KA22]MBU6951144.1 peptidylprolyl isomerase [Hahella sp. HN01]MDG9666876.1 peptidylprolyl isomerase [Hahella sp. CR1]QAY52650.1 peptidylprolyl isomerase [Hahella sp. KA22]